MPHPPPSPDCDIPPLFHPSVVGLWKEDLARTNAKAAQSLADPSEYENLFPELRQALQAEEALQTERASLRPAADFSLVPVSEAGEGGRERRKIYALSSPQSMTERNILEELEQGVLGQVLPQQPRQQEEAPPTAPSPTVPSTQSPPQQQQQTVQEEDVSDALVSIPFRGDRSPFCSRI